MSDIEQRNRRPVIMTPIKASVLVIGVALVALLIAFRTRDHEPVIVSVPHASSAPSFEVHILIPRSGQPLFGLLPESAVARLGGIPPELVFDQSSAGARIGRVGQERVEVSADGFSLSIEADGEGRVGPATRLQFLLTLSDRKRRLRCRPSDAAAGFLRTTSAPGASEVRGTFLFELGRCENVESGKVINWPPAPLTITGKFEGLRRSVR